MKRYFLKFILVLLGSLWSMVQICAEEIDLGSPYGYYHRSFVYDTNTQAASDSYGNLNNDVHYKFRVNAPTILLVHHAGSELSDTSMYLLKRTTETDVYTEIVAVHNNQQMMEQKNYKQKCFFIMICCLKKFLCLMRIKALFANFWKKESMILYVKEVLL